MTKKAAEECMSGKTHKEVIEEIFKNFQSVVKHTSSSKIMHMINPNLFVMWDEKIRNNWGCSSNARGYFNFLIRMQLELDELISDYARVKGFSKNKGIVGLLNELNGRIGQKYSITRWIDVYNWTKYSEKGKKL